MPISYTLEKRLSCIKFWKLHPSEKIRKRSDVWVYIGLSIAKATLQEFTNPGLRLGLDSECKGGCKIVLIRAWLSVWFQGFNKHRSCREQVDAVPIGCRLSRHVTSEIGPDLASGDRDSIEKKSCILSRHPRVVRRWHPESSTGPGSPFHALSSCCVFSIMPRRSSVTPLLVKFNSSWY